MSEPVLTEPELGDLGWIVARHGEVQAAEQGWDVSFEALIARIVADYGSNHDPRTERLWIARVDGARAGCVACVAGDHPDTAKLRILYVDPPARGRGLGRRLVDECIAFARGTGYQRLELWTISRLTTARRIYADAGFAVVAREPGRYWGQRLTGETWSLDLSGPAGRAAG